MGRYDGATLPLRDGCVWHGEGEDPAAATGSTQSRFEGSDRQGRGRIVAAVRRGPVEVARADELTGWDDDGRTARVVAGLVADGLVVEEGRVLRLPSSATG